MGFYVIAPQAQIEDGIFSKKPMHDAIMKTVKRRVDEYDESKSNWFNNWFLPFLGKIDIAAAADLWGRGVGNLRDVRK